MRTPRLVLLVAAFSVGCNPCSSVGPTISDHLLGWSVSTEVKNCGAMSACVTTIWLQAPGFFGRKTELLSYRACDQPEVVWTGSRVEVILPPAVPLRASAAPNEVHVSYTFKARQPRTR
jgi:hypothetical protein